VTYPLAGWIGSVVGLSAAAMTLAAIGALGLVAALGLWPAADPQVVPHEHPDLPPDHPHLREHGEAHSHPLVIDGLHRHWPKGAV
jgi:predicted MFS family arabinose efflux permease